jgi:hypothetical protein
MAMMPNIAPPIAPIVSRRQSNNSAVKPALIHSASMVDIPLRAARSNTWCFGFVATIRSIVSRGCHHTENHGEGFEGSAALMMTGSVWRDFASNKEIGTALACSSVENGWIATIAGFVPAVWRM